MRMISGIFTLIAVMILAAGSVPASAQEVTEHPLIRPFPGTVFDQIRSEYQNFNEYDFRAEHRQGIMKRIPSGANIATCATLYTMKTVCLTSFLCPPLLELALV